MINARETPVRIPGYRHIQNAQLISRLEGDGNYTLIYLRDAVRPLLVSQTLKYFECQLPNFLRVSKSLLINPVVVDHIVRLDAKTVHLHLLDCGQVTVSRRRVVTIMARLAKLAD